MLRVAEIFRVRNIATFLLCLMCITYIPLESRAGVSVIKSVVAVICPLIVAMYSLKFSKVVLWLSLYFLSVLFSAIFNMDSFRSSTILYLLSFLFYFYTYYNLIYHEKAFDLEYFTNLLKKIIIVFSVVLLIQQIFIISGIKYFPLINLTQVLNRGIGANSLTAEPSVLARILTISFLCLLRMYEVKWGRDSVTVEAIFKDAKWVVLGFLWSMVTMASGTAFVGLAILSLYFVKRRYLFTIMPLMAILYFTIPYIDYAPLNRAKTTFDAAITLNADNVIKADGSAAVRIVPLLNTFNGLDLSDPEIWFGKGVDSGGEKIHYFSKQNYMGGISSYGLLSYIFALIFLFSCVIHRFISLETLAAFLLVGMTVNNFAYIWGIYLLLTTSRYFIKGEV
ncbi:MAG: hypothetical protein R3Y50_02050 [Rikenellaceae bacterium]